MFTSFKRGKRQIFTRITIFTLLLAFMLVSGAQGRDIIKNQVEDIDILISQVFGGEPNVLMIYDSSLLMGVNFAGNQTGNWDDVDVTTTCNDPNIQFVCAQQGATSTDCQSAIAHCTGNAAGLNPCGSLACSGSRSGTCEQGEQFLEFLECIEDTYPASIVDAAYTAAMPIACKQTGNDPRTLCFDGGGYLDEAERAVAADFIENYALFLANDQGVVLTPNSRLNPAFDTSSVPPLNCGASACATGTDTDKSCGNDFPAFDTCSNSTNIQPSATACTAGQSCAPGFNGSTRLDMVIASFFDIIDADDSLQNTNCRDENGLLTGINNETITCEEFLNTPFRDSGAITSVNNARLPSIGGGQAPRMIDLLDINDQRELGIRIRPVAFGLGDLDGNTSCTGNGAIAGPQGGFAGGSQLNIDNVWKFFRDLTPEGRSNLAGVIGIDDSSASNSTYGDDALRDFRIQIQTGGTSECAPNFAIIISNGQDQCSGDGTALPGSVQSNTNFPPETGNANRRSTLQAVSNLRTHFVRNPQSSQSGNVVSEVLSFVICLGVSNSKSIRACNLMAITGGTSSNGIIQHLGPNGVSGAFDIDATSLSAGIKAVGKAEVGAANLTTNPAAVTLQNCMETNAAEGAPMATALNGPHCDFGPAADFEVFPNELFDSTAPSSLDSTSIGNSYAFFVNSPQELKVAFDTIFGFIDTFPTAGVSPTAPQSSTAVAARDRILLALIRPITDKRFWQGRLALYGFVPVPGSSGARTVIRKPSPGDDLTNASVVEDLSIFADDGSLNSNAQMFFWEAGKELAERDLSSDQRRIFTVDRTSDVDQETSGGVVERIRYEGERTDFCLAGSTGCNPGLDATDFGITDDDVTDPIPQFCTGATLADGSPNIGYVADCNADCAVLPFTAACKTCVKDCITQKVIDFFTGETYIQTRNDPLGEPTEDACPATGPGIIGCDCPDFEADPPVLTFENCSVRLGDIFHGGPILVASPNPLFFDVGFQAFGVNFRDRSAAVYANANDGGVHSFHAGELVEATPSSPETNPFTNQDEVVSFFSPGTGKELFNFITPSFQPDSRSQNDPFTPADPSGTSITGIPPDYRFGDMKTFIAENMFQRSWFDSTPVVADVFMDGYENGIQDGGLTGCSSTVSTDGEIDVCGKEWHTVLMTAYRNGGGAYTAIDVTNLACSNDNCDAVDLHKNTGPEYPRHLWTLFDKDFGNSWSDVTIGRARMQTESGGNTILVDRWLMYIGGGLDPIDTDPLDGVQFGNAFYVIDITTGQIVFKFHPTDPIPTNFPDPGNEKIKMTCDMAAKVGAFDLNNDGYVDVVYAGDTCGRLWEFDVSMPIIDTDNNVSNTGLRGNPSGSDPDIEASDWTGHIAFCAVDDISDCNNTSNIAPDQREAIFFAPTLVLDDLGRRHVIVGTGNRRNPSTITQFGRLYNFIDPFIPAFLAGGGAVGATTKTRDDFDPSAGQVLNLVPSGNGDNLFNIQGTDPQNNQGEFMVNFPNNLDSSGGNTTVDPKGEKAIGVPVVINRVLIFTTFAPPTGSGSTNACIAGTGEGRIFALDYLTGVPALNRVPGASELLSNQSNPDDISGLTAAEGMPSPAQLTYGTRGSVLLTVAFSGGPSLGGASFFVWELPPFPSRTQTLYWEEIL